MNPSIHEVWCHPSYCTVTDDLPVHGGEHQSAPVTVSMTGAIGPQHAAVRLLRSARTWLTDTFLVLDVAGTEVSLPVGVAQNVLATVGALAARTTPPPMPEDARAAEWATTLGFPASPYDDACPVDDLPEGTTFLGADYADRNWWAHDTGPDACGHRWSNPIRKPFNGVPILTMSRGGYETYCWFCDEIKAGHSGEPAAEAYIAEHTAMHETEVGR